MSEPRPCCCQNPCRCHGPEDEHQHKCLYSALDIGHCPADITCDCYARVQGASGE